MFSLMSRRPRVIAATLASLALTTMALLSGVAAVPAHAESLHHTWYVQAGTQSFDRTIQGMVFLPGTITIDQGDTIVWVAKSAEPHTVTFNAPPHAQFNPFAPDAGGHVVSNHTTYVSSAALANVPASVTGFPTEQRYALTFATTGVFPYTCLVHRGMSGTVKVQPAGTPYPESQWQYDISAHIQSGKILDSGHRMVARDIASSTNHYVIVGDTNMTTYADAMLYMRSEVVIHAGQSVTFVNKSMEPHTVTMGPELATETNPELQNPWCLTDCTASTLPSAGPIFGGSYSATLTGGDAQFNSGWIFNPTSVTLTFTHPGVYHYFCALHDYMGMVGKVVVTD